jgi:hypothetical protein
MRTTNEHEIRELDQRSGDGVNVTLLWHSETNRVFLTVEDERVGESFKFGVAAEDALDAFRHPYAYASTEYARAA